MSRAARKAVVRAFLWLVVIALGLSLQAWMYLVSHGSLVARDPQTAEVERLNTEEKAVHKALDNPALTNMERAQAMKEMAIFHLSRQNFAAARDTFLAAEKVVARDGADSAHIKARIDLKSQAGMAMADCGLYQESEPLFLQAQRLLAPLERLDKPTGMLARARVLNDQGTLYYLWANSSKELPERQARFERSMDCYRNSFNILKGVEAPADSPDGRSLNCMRRAVIENLRILQEDLKYEPLASSV